MKLIEILAQASQPTSAPAGPPPPGWYQALVQFFPIIALVVVFYFLMSGTKRKQDRQRQDMLGQLKKGDRIQTIGGILGTVVEVREEDVLVKVDETTNTKMRFTRSAIHRVVEEEKAENK